MTMRYFPYRPLFVYLLLPLLGSVGMASTAHAQEDTSADLPHVAIEHVDAVGYPDQVLVSVLVRDDDGYVHRDLSADAFVLQEDEQQIDAVEVVLSPTVTTIAVVLDIHRGLTPDALYAEIGDTLNEFMEQLPRNAQDRRKVFTSTSPAGESAAIEVHWIVPSVDGNAPFEKANITNLHIAEDTQNEIQDTIENRADDNEQTDVYAAIHQAVDREPDSVIVLSNGQDRTEDTDLLNSAGEQAQQQDIPIHVVEFAIETPAEDTRSALHAVAEDTNGIYELLVVDTQINQNQLDVVEALVQAVVGNICGSSTYLLAYVPPGPAREQEDPTAAHTERSIQIGLKDTPDLIAQATYTPAPAPDNIQLDTLPIHASGYPTVTMVFTPENVAHRAPSPPLTLDTIDVAINGASLAAFGEDGREQLSLQRTSTTGAESIGLVVDLRMIDANQQADQSLASAFVDAVISQPQLRGMSRLALFANTTFSPQVGQASAEIFQTDYSRMLNSSLRLPDFIEKTEGDIGDALARAIVATADDAAAADEPAHVVVFSNEVLPFDSYDRVLALAHERHVMIHVLTSAPAPDVHPRLKHLAHGTGGEVYHQATPRQLEQFASSLADARPAGYETEFLSPLLADGEPISLTLGLRDTDVMRTTVQQAEISGEPIIAPPVFLVRLLQVGAAVLIFILFARFARIPTPGQMPGVVRGKPAPTGAGSTAGNVSDSQAVLQEIDHAPPDERLDRALEALASYGSQHINQRRIQHEEDRNDLPPESFWNN
jgi:hypothetical protein